MTENIQIINRANVMTPMLFRLKKGRDILIGSKLGFTSHHNHRAFFLRQGLFLVLFIISFNIYGKNKACIANKILDIDRLNATKSDTVYPGTDLAILKMEPLKKEVFPGEGIAINMIVMNYGFSESAPTRIDFWISEEDEPDLDTNNINSTKLLAPLKMDTKVDFSHLVVIPADYSGKYVYITAVINANPKNGPDPTPGNNTMFTAVRIGSADSYKGGIYSYDGAMREVSMVNPIRKLKRGKPYPFQVKYSITGVRPPKAGQSIDIVLSADPELDDTDVTIATFPAIPGVNGAIMDIKKDLVFGRQFRKGKAYIFAVIRPGKWKDPNMDNNYSKPLKIRLK